MRTFGLIGYPLGHSFSQKYFTEKFAQEQITDARYALFPLENIYDFVHLWKQEPTLQGLNVTIPYKQAIIPFLDEIDPIAKRIGAVNVIQKMPNGWLKGFNSDYDGFLESLRFKVWAKPQINALILGTGGSSKSVQAALEDLAIPFQLVSRDPQAPQVLNYAELTPTLLHKFHWIINTTPAGMYPEVENMPPIPYEGLTHNHFLYDLIYNPAETAFLKKGKLLGAQIKNGLEMLHLQADCAWNIWNAPAPK